MLSKRHKLWALLQDCWNLIPDLACVWYTQLWHMGGTMEHYCQIFTEQVSICLFTSLNVQSRGGDTVGEQTMQLAMRLVNIWLLDDAVSKWMSLSANTLANPSTPSFVVRYHHSSTKKTVRTSGVSPTILRDNHSITIITAIISQQ